MNLSQSGYTAWDRLPKDVKSILRPVISEVIKTKNVKANPLGVGLYEVKNTKYVIGARIEEGNLIFFLENAKECETVDWVIVEIARWR